MGDDQAIPSCTSLLQCFITVFDDGLRANDIGGTVEPVQSPDIKDLSDHHFLIYYVQSAYALLFWFIVCIILLNVIFGIIIDSFGELRLHRQMIQGKIDNECFICGIDRFTLDTQGGGFDRHCAEEHDKWNYLFMMVMLREKDPSEYNGWEQFVASQCGITSSQVSSNFMPRNNALSLKEHKEREEAEVRKREEQALRTYELCESMSASIGGILARQDEMDKKLVKIAEGGGGATPRPGGPGRGSSKMLLRTPSAAGGLASPR